MNDSPFESSSDQQSIVALSKTKDEQAMTSPHLEGKDGEAIPLPMSRHATKTLAKQSINDLANFRP